MLSVEIKKAFPSFSLDINFEAGNETLALLGASGCGKSMTLRCIAGIVKPDNGRIVCDGRVLFDSARHINLPPQKRELGLLFQNYALFPNMTVEENIRSGFRQRTKAGNTTAELSGLLEQFYLTGQRRHYPAQLSGGQQQRCALARIFAGKPGLIMLDEPLSALDSYLRWQLEQELLTVLEGFPGTAVYVSHNRDEVYRLCEKVCVVNNGKSEQIAGIRELFASPATLSAALLSGCKNFSRAQKLSADTVLAADWNCRLVCGEVSDDIRYIGVRAHHIAAYDTTTTPAQPAQNILRCRVKRVTRDLFSTIVTLIPEGAPNTDFGVIRMEISGQGLAEAPFSSGDVLEVGIAGEAVLLLK
jgi:molybdate transport system ATP-binding protein